MPKHLSKMREEERKYYKKVAKHFIEEHRGLLRRMSGVDDVVKFVCPLCQFEDRNGHAPTCGGNS